MRHVRPYALTALAVAYLIIACADRTEQPHDDARDVERSSVHISSTDGTSTSDAGEELLDAPDSDYVLLTGGRRVHRSCIHQVPDGASIDWQTGEVTNSGAHVSWLEKCRYKTKGDGTASDIPSAIPDHYTWQEWDYGPPVGIYCNATQLAAPWFDSIYAEVEVPYPPASIHGQTVGFWIGLEPFTSDYVFQPVLMWGVFGCGANPPVGDNNWRFASMAVGGVYGAVCTTTSVPIAAGNIVKFNVFTQANVCSVSSGTGCWYGIRAWVDGLDNRQLNVKNNPKKMDAAYRAVLEAYNIHSCQYDFPRGGILGQYLPIFNQTQVYQPCTTATDYFNTGPVWEYQVDGDRPQNHNDGSQPVQCTWGVTDTQQGWARLSY